MDNMQPTSPSLSSQVPGMKQIKIPMASLPQGTKEGDTLSLSVHAVDKNTGTAYLAPVESLDAEMPDADKSEEAASPAENEPEETPDKDVLLGPMDGLKNYLVQKSMDVPKNEGR